MPRGVDKGDDADASLRRIGDDAVHLSLGQLVICTGIIVCLVARLDGAFHLVAGERALRAVDAVAQRHVIQQEAQAVVADRQLQVVIAVLRHLVDEVFDLLLCKVFSAAVEMKDPHRCVCAVPRRQGGRGQQAQHQNKAEQDRKQSFLHCFSLSSSVFICPAAICCAAVQGRAGRPTDAPGGRFTAGYPPCAGSAVSTMTPPFLRHIRRPEIDFNRHKRRTVFLLIIIYT